MLPVSAGAGFIFLKTNIAAKNPAAKQTTPTMTVRTTPEDVRSVLLFAFSSVSEAESDVESGVVSGVGFGVGFGVGSGVG